jgi:hypothetical protein
MNPYLEQEVAFHDFHQTCIPIIRELLNERIRPRYFAAVDITLYIHEPPAEQRRALGKPDVIVAKGSAAGDAEGAARFSQPAPAYGLLPLEIDEVRLSYLEIRRLQDRRLVTVIEMLSPSNKYAGGDRQKYLQKRRDIFATDVHLVEIDLLRGGPRLPLDGMPDCDYCALVGRATERPKVGIFPIGLRERLPTIPIPLIEPDGDAMLDLKQMLDIAYDRSGYDEYIYERSPEPALRPADAEWAKQFVPSAPPTRP